LNQYSTGIFMRTVRARVVTALAAIAALSGNCARAAEPGFYVGFLYGDASKEYSGEAFDDWTREAYVFLRHDSDQRGVTSEASDGEAYGFLAGYRLTQHIAFEGGYTYIGKQSYRENSTGVFVPPDPEAALIPETINAVLTSKTSGFALSAMGILPISYAWEIYGRAGLYIGSNTLRITVNGEVPLLREEFNESSTDFLAGAGISVSLAEVYSLRAEFQRIFAAGAKEFGEADVDLISIGLTVAF
jgi:hypothetical protein